MIGSAQKAPVASAAITALNLAVVRQVVFERAAEQISEKRKRETEAVVATAEENRQRNEAVTVVIEQSEHRSEETKEAADTNSGGTGADQPDPQRSLGQNVDLEV